MVFWHKTKKAWSAFQVRSSFLPPRPLRTFVSLQIWGGGKLIIWPFAGYLAIFFFGIDTGLYVLPPDPYFAFRDWTKGGKTPFKPKLGKLATVLASYTALWWSAYAVSHYTGLEVSRRLVRLGKPGSALADDLDRTDRTGGASGTQANLGYVFWTVAFNVSTLLAYLVVDIVYRGAAGTGTASVGGGGGGDSGTHVGHPNLQQHTRDPPTLFDAINRNGLAVFLFVRNPTTPFPRKKMGTF
jgi:phosphatidylinositol glycan class W